jgi:hypothetical protein
MPMHLGKWDWWSVRESLLEELMRFRSLVGIGLRVEILGRFQSTGGYQVIGVTTPWTEQAGRWFRRGWRLLGDRSLLWDRLVNFESGIGSIVSRFLGATGHTFFLKEFVGFSPWRSMNDDRTLAAGFARCEACWTPSITANILKRHVLTRFIARFISLPRAYDVLCRYVDCKRSAAKEEKQRENPCRDPIRFYAVLSTVVRSKELRTLLLDLGPLFRDYS